MPAIPETASKPIPNPGSNEAIEQNCSCAVLDNGHGRGCGRYDEHGKPLFWITWECPLHAPKPPVESETAPV